MWLRLGTTILVALGLVLLFAIAYWRYALNLILQSSILDDNWLMNKYTCNGSWFYTSQTPTLYRKKLRNAELKALVMTNDLRRPSCQKISHSELLQLPQDVTTPPTGNTSSSSSSRNSEDGEYILYFSLCHSCVFIGWVSLITRSDLWFEISSKLQVKHAQVVYYHWNSLFGP